MSEGEVVVQKRHDEVSAKVSAVQLLLCLIRQEVHLSQVPFLKLS